MGFRLWKTYGIGTFSHMKFSFHMWNRRVFTCEIPNSRLKWLGTNFHLWNVGIERINVILRNECIIENLLLKSCFINQTMILHTFLGITFIDFTGKISWQLEILKNVGIRTTCFTCETEDSYMKIDFTFEIFISFLELKHLYIWNTIFIRQVTCKIFLRDAGCSNHLKTGALARFTVKKV